MSLHIFDYLGIYSSIFEDEFQTFLLRSWQVKTIKHYQFYVFQLR